jgi:hypothetical protein
MLRDEVGIRPAFFIFSDETPIFRVCLFAQLFGFFGFGRMGEKSWFPRWHFFEYLL